MLRQNKGKTLAAIRQLKSELRPYELKAEEEIRNRSSRVLGVIRGELLKECHRKLFEISCVAKNRISATD
jgi:hypothetical protein